MNRPTSNYDCVRPLRIPIYLARFARSWIVAIAFGVLVSFFVSGCDDDRPVPNQSLSSKSSELMRVTSPNGYLDAVLVMDSYGGAAGGGVDTNLYIVRKGAQVFTKPGHEVLTADPMSGGRLIWKRSHLLEVHYDIAYIHGFRNLWGLHEIQNVGSAGEGDFEVEIQLMPASDSSALTPDGSYRRIGDH